MHEKLTGWPGLNYLAYPAACDPAILLIFIVAILHLEFLKNDAICQTLA